MSTRLADVKVEAIYHLLVGHDKVEILLKQTQIGSNPRNFRMRLRMFQKRAMNCLMTKRYVLPDGIHTLPYDHCDIPIHDCCAELVEDIISAIENVC